MSKVKWTTDNIPSLAGKTIIVTGGNSGLGFQSVKAYCEKGAHVIMACRSVSRGEEAKNEILKTCKNADIVVMQLDLADLSSVRKFVDEFKKSHQQLHILLNNAGIMMVPYGLTKDGIESQQGTNYFGHFALTGLLLDVLKNTPKSRVINVSSLAHKQGVMDFDNLLFDRGKGYASFKAYGRSKLENLLFTYELQRYFETNRFDTIAVAAHPGTSNTNLFSHIGGKFLQALLKPLMSLFIQPSSMGALPELRASVDPDAKGGEFYGPDGRGGLRGYPVIVQPNNAAKDKESARRLWEFSEKITGVKY